MAPAFDFRAMSMDMTAVSGSGPNVGLKLRSIPRGPRPVIVSGTNPVPNIAVRNSRGFRNMVGSTTAAALAQGS